MKMYKSILQGFILIAAWLTLSSAALVAAPHRFASALQLDTARTAAWQQPFTIKNDEFSILMPEEPSVHLELDVPYPFGGGTVTRHVEAGAYKDGVVYLVEIYDNSSPEKFLRSYQKYPTPSRRWKGAVTTEIPLGGLKGRQYVVKTEDLYLVSQAFNSKRRSYVITVAARGEGNPSMQRFLASLRMVQQKSQAGVVGPANVTSGNNISGGAQPNPPKDDTGAIYGRDELTRAAALVWKPEPSYTESARKGGITGTVTLRAVLSASGDVSDITLVKGLGGGLTEKAIGAAGAIKFIPAEKDGRLASQRVTLEYNFNIY